VITDEQAGGSEERLAKGLRHLRETIAMMERDIISGVAPILSGFPIMVMFAQTLEAFGEGGAVLRSYDRLAAALPKNKAMMMAVVALVCVKR
jgi:hypothetical protein